MAWLLRLGRRCGTAMRLVALPLMSRATLWLRRRRSARRLAVGMAVALLRRVGGPLAIALAVALALTALDAAIATAIATSGIAAIAAARLGTHGQAAMQRHAAEHDRLGPLVRIGGSKPGTTSRGISRLISFSMSRRKPFLVDADQRDRLALRAGAAGAADAVHVVLGHVGQLVVDDVRQLVDVDAARGDVGRHQHAAARRS